MTHPRRNDQTEQIPAVDAGTDLNMDQIFDHPQAERVAAHEDIEPDTDPGRQVRWVLPTLTMLLISAGLFVVGAGMGTHLTDTEENLPDPWENIAVPTMPAEAAGQDEEHETTAFDAGVGDLVDSKWVARISTESHISEPVLAAYAGAALHVNAEFVQCNLGWNTLAAIGYVETQHGSFGGSAVGPDGVVIPHIVGPRLDGSGELAEISDTDQGLIDGDSQYDRAVGPMQFIPATWEHFGQDGSGDGVADIHNIEDAALSAAVYLCSYGDMTVQENWIAAIDAYNPSVEYNHEVADRAQHYNNFN